MNDLPLRTLTAVVIASITIAGIWAGGYWFLGFAALVGGASLVEWVTITTPPDRRRPLAIAIAGLVAALGAAYFVGLLAAGAILLLTGIGVRMTVAEGTSVPLLPALGPVYIGIAAIGLVWLREAEANGMLNVVLVMVCVWATDIGAYFAGRTIGGPKLAPRISPKKTWAGLGGGVVAAAAAAVMLGRGLGDGSVGLLIAAGAALAVVSQGGDLMESALKRRFGVKDSGRILPGHGGLLDRIDGILAAAPIAAVFLALFGSGALWN